MAIRGVDVVVKSSKSSFSSRSTDTLRNKTSKIFIIIIIMLRS